MSSELDTSELLQFGDDLRRLARTAVPRVRPVISKAALNIKTRLVAEMRESDYFRKAAPSISYDLRGESRGIEAEIGPDKARAPGGKLANIAYFGGSHGGGATVPDPLFALEAEEPTLLRYLAEILEEL